MGRSPTKHRMTGGTRTADHTPHGTKIIVDRQYNVSSPHPHPSQGGRLVPNTGLNLVMLADGTTLYECDDCGWLHEKSASVISHMGSHNSVSKLSPDYDIKVLKQLVQTVAKYKNSRVRGFAEKTAVELNDLGVKTLDGRPWTAAAVSRLYTRWKDDARVKTRQPRKVTSTTKPFDFTSSPGDQRLNAPALTSAQALAATLEQIGDRLLTVVSAMRDVAGQISQLDDALERANRAELEILRQKADRWDDLRASLR